MSIRPDSWIIKQCRDNGLIEPFFDEPISSIRGKKVISYGISAYGYDVRVADEFKVIYKHVYIGGTPVIDPKTNYAYFAEFKQDIIEIPPNSMMLCRSLEYLRIPRDTLGIGVGKSTYARCGVIANITPLEPEWEGYLTISLSNTSPLPVKIYAFEGIAQLIFHQTKDVCTTSYRDKDGKYQGQTEVTGSRV